MTLPLFGVIMVGTSAVGVINLGTSVVDSDYEGCYTRYEGYLW